MFRGASRAFAGDPRAQRLAAEILDSVTAGELRRFGRFPHRNSALGRRSTLEEIEFLKTWAERAAPKGAAALKG